MSKTFFDLTQPWPLGLSRASWPAHVKAVVLALFAVVWFDVWISQSAMALPEVWRAPFFFITDFGLSDWVLIPALVLLVAALAIMLPLRRGRYRRAFYEFVLLSGYLFIGVGAPGLAANIMKRLIGRGRPVVYDEVGGFEFQRVVNDWTFQSFPSGHATTSLAIAFVIGFMAPRFFWILLLIAAAAALSRVPVGMHYPTDVVAGFVVGTLGAYLVRNEFARRRWLFKRHADGTVHFRGLPGLRRLWRGWRRKRNESLVA
ncbi:phosphatase PAP2 family protein [Devosia nitrariae]|uniref:Phosphatase PAP2 family protein n=1 Tax=Devosia nitrariae TaxID=2071872 RepID=A0ABQ5WDL8_9HYPH|nr:phosphatase PAP2 family protein [Devosia nitrariae]GLQ57691.1 phosphatase PAP2 family protein [Devosia nitrariae]